jgi:hypothetical protein
MGLRADWANGKATAKKAGFDPEKAFAKKQDFGLYLDKVEKKEAAYERGMRALALAPNEAKEKRLKDELLQAIAEAMSAGANCGILFNDLLKHPATAVSVKPVDDLFNIFTQILISLTNAKSSVGRSA